MSLLRRTVYVGLGALLALAVVIGGVAVFAQDGDEVEKPPAQDDEDTETEEGTQEEGELQPDRDFPGLRGRLSVWGGDSGELLAETLGISVEELEAAYEEVRAAAIEEAREAGRITEEQAERLLEGTGRPGRGLFGLVADKDELLAEALGISVEELQAARSEVRTAQLEAMVEAGILTQEEADLIAAQEAVAGYIDQEGLEAALQDVYEAAIEAALDAGAITQEQADQLLENLPTFGRFGFGRGGRHHGPIFRGGPGGDVFVPGTIAPAIDIGINA